MVTRSHAVPGPRGLPLLGSPWMVGRDPLVGLPALVRRFGDVVTFRIGSRRAYILAHPDDIETVLLTHAKVTTKDSVTRDLSSVLGSGLLTSEGAFWKSQRRSIAPAFQPRALERYGDAMAQTAHEHLDGLRAGEHDLHQLSANITLDILVRTVFGEEPGGLASTVGVLMHDMMAAFMTEQRTGWRFVPGWIPAAHRQTVEAANGELDRIIGQIVSKARTREPGPDLLSALISAKDEDGRVMSDHELRDELVTLLLAGHETTAVALSMIAWLLSEHPEIQARAHQEVDQVLVGATPVMADVRRLPLLSAIIDETLRLYPPAWAIAREATEDIQVGGCVLEAGAQIVMAPWVTQRDPRFWVGPSRFRPDRWLNGETDDLPRMAWFPYGGGRRVCVGQHFAKMEMVLVLTVLLQGHTLGAVPGFAPELAPAVTLRPCNGMRLTTTPRDANRPSSG